MVVGSGFLETRLAWIVDHEYTPPPRMARYISLRSLGHVLCMLHSLLLRSLYSTSLIVSVFLQFALFKVPSLKGL